MADYVVWDEDQLEQVTSLINQQYQNAAEQASAIRSVVRVLENGSWKGDRAEEFFAAKDEYLKFADQVNDEVLGLAQSLQQVINAIKDLGRSWF